jgi:hypothetical protein
MLSSSYCLYTAALCHSTAAGETAAENAKPI